MRKINCNKYADGKLPPCASLLGNSNPLIKDNKIIFRNLNRLFYFICIQPRDSTKTARIFINIQISLSTFIIGLFINQIECKNVEYNDKENIHSDDKINAFIHSSIKNPHQLDFEHRAFLSLVYSNGNAILTPLQYNIDISLNNFLILLAINRIENDPSLLFVNNSEASEDIINFILSEIDITFEKRDKC